MTAERAGALVPDDAFIEAVRAQLAAAGGAPVERIDTHISWVLLTRTHAYKFKKPVRLGFLDFSTLAARRRYCEEELRLNRRLAPEVYLDVVAVRGTPSSPRLAADGAETHGAAAPAGEPLEYALRMKCFAPGAVLADMLAAGQLAPAHIDRLAARIAHFHDEAPVAAADGPWGEPRRHAEASHAVLAQLADLGAGPACAGLAAWVDAQGAELEPVWAARRRAGRVREGHGDLHLGNTVLLGEDATAFDCIEFDPALRWIDVIDDAGFFAMDLLAHGRADLAWRFLDAYLMRTGDYEGLRVLRFTLVYRALVRAMAGLMRGAALAPAAADAAKNSSASGAGAAAPSPGTPAAYLALAQALVRRGGPAGMRPALAITHGLSGSGKTTAAQALLEAAGAVRVRSDVERKRLFGLAPLASSGGVAGGIYGADATARTYARLAEVARIGLAAGWPVVIDAAFLRRDERARFAALAREVGAPFLVLDCRADPDVLRARLAARQARADDASEADAAVLERQFGWDEALTPDELACAAQVDTTRALDGAALAARWFGAGCSGAG